MPLALLPFIACVTFSWLVIHEQVGARAQVQVSYVRAEDGSSLQFAACTANHRIQTGQGRCMSFFCICAFPCTDGKAADETAQAFCYMPPKTALRALGIKNGYVRVCRYVYTYGVYFGILSNCSERALPSVHSTFTNAQRISRTTVPAVPRGLGTA